MIVKRILIGGEKMAIRFVTDKIVTVYNIYDENKIMEIAKGLECNHVVRIAFNDFQLFFNTAKNAKNFASHLN